LKEKVILEKKDSIIKLDEEISYLKENI